MRRRRFEDEQPALIRGQHGTVGCTDRETQRTERFAAAIGPDRIGRQVADARSGELRLPPLVADRCVSTAHHVVEKVPGFRIERLAGAKHGLQRREIVRFGVSRPEAHQHARERRRRVEFRHAFARDHIVDHRGVREIRRPFAEHDAITVRERTVDHDRMPDDPADIARAPIHVVGRDTGGQAQQRAATDQVPAMRQHDALRLPRRAAGIENEQWVFGIDDHRGTRCRLLIAVRLEVDLAIIDERPRFPAPDDDAPDLRQTRDRVIDDRLQIDCLPAPVRHVANDHHGRAGIIDTIA